MFGKVFGKVLPKKGSPSPLKEWNRESYDSLRIQRNFLIAFSFIAIIAVIGSLFVIRYVRSIKSVVPFIIEIEKRSGVPTVVHPVSVKEYSANEAVKRYFIMQYIKAREEYLYETFRHNYKNVVRLMSSSDVYYRGYVPEMSTTNPDSPYNLYRDTATKTVEWRSIIFREPNLAEVRFVVQLSGSANSIVNKIALVGFDFIGVSMNDNERLINPLGFVVKLYKVDEENVSQT